MENTSAEDQETIREFLVESHENLSRLDQDLVELEKHPHDADLLGSIFRTIHTIKGACGFLAFSVLEAITHQAETLLSQLRDGQRELNPALVSLILETVDATRKVLAAIETSGKEGSEGFEDLTERLRLSAQLTAGEETRPAFELNGASTLPNSVAEPALEKTSSDTARDRTGRGSTREEREGEKGTGEKKMSRDHRPQWMQTSGLESGCWINSWTWWESWCSPATRFCNSTWSARMPLSTPPHNV